LQFNTENIKMELLEKKLTILLILFSFTLDSQAQLSDSKLENLLVRAKETNSEAVIIYRGDQLITEKYFGKGTPDAKIESMSCTKSIVGIAVACMLSDGLIPSLDVPVANYYPEWKQGQKQLITIRHLVNMTSGIQNHPNASVEIYPSNNFVQLALTAELSHKPGEVFAYNNKSLNLMAGVVQKITGKRMDDYIGERLFKPLKITDYSWTLDSVGNPHVMSGCQIRPRDFIKIGLLLLNKGKYEQRQVITEKAIDEVVKPCAQFEGYGMLWWLDYEKTTSIVDDEIIIALEKEKVASEFVQKMIKMKGVYQSNEAFTAKLKQVFGDDHVTYVNQNLKPGLRLRKRQFSGKVTYRADGYLGNYIIVDPKSSVVGVRMISHQSFRDAKDNFADFAKLVSTIAE